MEEEKLTYSEFVLKLVGSIEPYGSTEIDEEHMENLKKCEGIIFALVDKVCSNIRYAHGHNEYSIVANVDASYEILKELNEQIKDYMEDWEKERSKK